MPGGAGGVPVALPGCCCLRDSRHEARGAVCISNGPLLLPPRAAAGAAGNPRGGTPGTQLCSPAVGAAATRPAARAAPDRPAAGWVLHTLRRQRGAATRTHAHTRAGTHLRAAARTASRGHPSGALGIEVPPPPQGGTPCASPTLPMHRDAECAAASPAATPLRPLLETPIPNLPPLEPTAGCRSCGVLGISSLGTPGPQIRYSGPGLSTQGCRAGYPAPGLGM